MDESIKIVLNDPMTRVTEILGGELPIEACAPLVKEAVTNLRYVLHGNSSTSDIEMISEKGLNTLEGRATLSANLLHAFSWASTHEKRRLYSKSQTRVAENETGKIFVVEVPNNLQVYFATFTDIQMDGASNISGDPLKYASGMKQLGIYNKGHDPEVSREKLELAKEEIGVLKKSPDALLNKDAIDQLREQSEIPILIDKDHLVAIIDPNPGLLQILLELEKKVLRLDNIDLDKVEREIRETPISTNSPAILAEIVRDLVKSTVESVLVSRIRMLSLAVERNKGNRITRQGETVNISLYSDSHQLESSLTALKNRAGQPDFSLGIGWLDEYVKTNISMLIDKLKSN